MHEFWGGLIGGALGAGISFVLLTYKRRSKPPATQDKGLIQQVIHDFRRPARVVVRNDAVLAKEERAKDGDL